jgi:hypothetical protein
MLGISEAWQTHADLPEVSVNLFHVLHHEYLVAALGLSFRGPYTLAHVNSDSSKSCPILNVVDLLGSSLFSV